MQGYPYPAPRPPQSSNTLVIVLVIVVAVLLLGGASCVMCVGLAAFVGDNDAGEAKVTPADDVTAQLEAQMRKQGVDVTRVTCPPVQGEHFVCELVVGADRAAVNVTRTSKGIAFDTPNVAFLDGAKLLALFRAQVSRELTVPCFTGMLMKNVGAEFSCRVLSGAAEVGDVKVSVGNAAGDVRLTYVPDAKPQAPRRGPRVVELTCPPGQPPGGAVRAGCLCGDEIIGTACGAPGNFTDVVGTPRGCRFTCAGP